MLRSDAEFDLFRCIVVQTQKLLHVEDPALQRRRKRPRRYEDSCEEHSFSNPQLYYKTVYFQCLDTAISTIRDRFHQHDYYIYVSLEQLLLKASSNDYSDELGENEFASCSDDRHKQFGVFS